ncbi:MAG: hypothetical protein NTZ47_05925 [Bacteroidetes bacterium]|nr:hypothetical protein [Bacteroidota bacterium]
MLCIFMYLKPFNNRSVPHFLSSPSFEPSAVPEAVGQSPLSPAKQLLLHPVTVVIACDDFVHVNGALPVTSAASASFHAGTEILVGRVGPPSVMPIHLFMYGTHPPDDWLLCSFIAPCNQEAFTVSAHKHGWNFLFGKSQQLGVVDCSLNSCNA